MDSVMDFVNISSIYHAIQKRQLPHYQTIKDLKRGNVRDVRDKKREKLGFGRISSVVEREWICFTQYENNSFYY